MSRAGTLFRTAIVGLVGLAAAPVTAQMSKDEALRIGSDVRWTNANCPATKINYDATDRLMASAGLVDPFNPDGPLQDYLLEHDKKLDDGAKSVGAQIMCQSLLDRYRSAGLIALRSLEDLDRLNRIRASSGANPISPLQ